MSESMIAVNGGNISFKVLKEKTSYYSDNIFTYNVNRSDLTILFCGT